MFDCILKKPADGVYVIEDDEDFYVEAFVINGLEINPGHFLYNALDTWFRDDIDSRIDFAIKRDEFYQENENE